MDLARIIDGKKFMWDGKVYEKKEDADETAGKYRSDGFEVRCLKEGNDYYLFTRRVVTEVKVEGNP